MVQFLEDNRKKFSFLLGAVLCILVLLFWTAGKEDIRDSFRAKVADTHDLVMQQYDNVLMRNVYLLQNLKRRLEFTNGRFFEYWSTDARSIIQQEPSFIFIEWIDSSMVIQRIEPLQGNEQALNLDISTLAYRRSDWNQARKDSVFNLTDWVELTQGDSAFLVDQPVYFNGEFQGTITAGMDFTKRFNEIMKGLEQYHVRITDNSGTVFYRYGSQQGTGNFKSLAVSDSLLIADANPSSWTVTMVPNYLFGQANAVNKYNMDLILALFLCILLTATFYYMLKASAAEKAARQANNNLRALIDSAPITIFVIDDQGRVVDFWNNAAEEMLGWKKEEVRGKILPYLETDEGEDVKANIQQAIDEGGIARKKVVRSRKDGNKGTYLLHMGSITGKDRRMLVILEDITKEKRIEQQLKESLHEKEILLREVHHRVKNNLAIMVGLLELQAEEAKDRKSRHLLNETKNRIFSIFEVHELLYQNKDFTKVNFSDYLDKQLARIKSSYDPQIEQVHFHTNVDNAIININLAIPLGLLFNELITNSLQHAFKNHTGQPVIEITFKEKDGLIELEYRDNGRGMERDFFTTRNSMGLTIIRTLLRQLAADYTFREKEGFHIVFRFRNKSKGAHSNI